MTPTPHTLDNEMILASAGSGKTYQLTNRYIGLLADARPPESIVALTFTRKAAGEFFDSILTKLATAASSPDEAQKLTAELGRSDLTQRDFRNYLRLVIDRMPILTLGTLDSFFANIVRNFPFEFGLGGGYQILDDHVAAIERRRVYRHVFQRRPANAEEQRTFLESFKLATFGSEENSLMRNLDMFVGNHHHLYLGAPDAAQWGNPNTIWPRGCRWLGFQTNLQEDIDALMDSFGASDLDNRHWDKWQRFAKAVRNHTPGASLGYDFRFVFDRLVDAFHDLELENAEIKMWRVAYRFSPEQCDLLVNIISHIIATELEVRLKRTRGLWSILDRYEAIYSQLVRRHGRLTFFDLALILTGSASERRPVLSQRPGENDRMQIDYRLDARYQHWLLDEFQDTSRLQWAVIENLIDEALQDVSGERTFFQVGDIKQAIYAWRGGDVKLFHEIRSRYSEGERAIREKPLNDSWRSGPDIIRMVNLVFGDQNALESVCGEDAVKRWEWKPHNSVHDFWPGYAGLFQSEHIEKATIDEKNEARYALMLELLKEADPVGRGHSCAILTRDNRQGSNIVDYIRAHSDLPVINESDIAVGRDNPLSAAFLSLFQFAAHPGDRFAEQHLRMTPFAAAFEAEDLTMPQVSSRVLASVHRHGVEFTIEVWMRKLTDSGCVLDAFSQRRAAELSNAAHLFDQSGGRNLDEFIEFASNFTVREPELHGVIQVLTIHKAKGLGFDVVFLPELGGKSLDNIDEQLAVHQNRDGDIEWIYRVPPSVIAKAEPTLADHREAAKADAAYEELCVYYVAMTRAKRANFLIIDPLSSKSQARNFTRLLGDTLGGLGKSAIRLNKVSGTKIWESGSRDWWNDPNAQPEAPPEPKPDRQISVSADFPRFARHRRRTPSDAEAATVPATALFSTDAGNARAFGNAVHAVFQGIHWIDDWNPDKPTNDIETRALETVRSCLEVSEIARFFRHPDSGPEPEVWRERRFEMLHDGAWISGAIDRAIIHEDRAEIIDFKTDGDPDEKTVEKYQPQLEIYRQALARLTGIAIDSISGHLVFTTTRTAT